MKGDKAEAKDYTDVAAMLEHGVALSAALGTTRAVYGEMFNPHAEPQGAEFFGSSGFLYGYDAFPSASRLKLPLP